MEQNLELEKVNLQITGMTCSACAQRIEKGVAKLPGIDSAFVNLPLETAYIRFAPSKIDIRQVIEKIGQLGFSASIPDNEGYGNAGEAAVRIQRNRFLGSLLFTLPLMWPMLHHFQWTQGLWVPHSLTIPWVQLLLATFVQFLWGLPFIMGAYRALRSCYANMDVLVALGTLSAYLYSHYLVFHPLQQNHHQMLYFESSATIITVVWLGKWLESKARYAVHSSMQSKNSLLPQQARVINPEGENSIPAGQLRAGDIILIRCGEIIPVDGKVYKGSGMTDESALTGESRPLAKTLGTEVTAGSRLVSGELTVTVHQVGGQSTLGQMIRSMEEAQSLKTNLQAHADRAAAWFVPSVIVLSLASMGYWYVIGAPGDWAQSLKIAISVIVCACPCAVGLAAPLSIFIGSRRALDRGILFRHGSAMEALQRTNTMLLDKTGTLTLGIPKVSGIKSNVRSVDELLRLVASAEKECEHPIAGAFVREAGNRKIILIPAKNVRELPGFGVQAEVDGIGLLIGSERLLQLHGIACPKLPDSKQWESQGKTVMHIALQGSWEGVAAVSDSPRPGIAEALRRLRAMRIQQILVTGDGIQSADHLARLTGISDIRANLLPSDKLRLVKEMRRQGKFVAVIGDGINDAPAMAASHSSITVRNATAAAKEVSDVHLLRDDFQAIADAVFISRQTVRNIRQNLGWAFVYNAMILPAAISGNMEPWAAGTAMAISSVTVVWNALRLDRKLRRAAA